MRSGVWPHVARHVAPIVLALTLVPMLSRPTAAADCLPLTPTLRDGNLIVPGVRGGVVYAAAGAGRQAALLMDLYSQRAGTRVPLVIVVHGGGWTTGSRVAHVGQLLELLTDAGYSWAAIDYRQGGIARWREAADDVRAAIGFVRCHAANLRVDPDRIVLLGEDSGAQLVAHAAADSNVAAAVLLGGLYDLTTRSALKAANAATLREASVLGRDGPMASLRSPTYVVHGGNDTEVPLRQAEAFCEGLNARGGRCDLDVVADASHRSENWWPSQWGYKQRLVGWLSRVVGPGVTDVAMEGRTMPAARDPAQAGRYEPGLHKRIVYEPKSKLTLDASLPLTTGPHVPVILVHGGGWEAGDRVTYITPLFRPLADAELAWFSIDYRLTPDVRHEAQVQDLRDAITFVRARASQFAIDPRKLVIVGESASGQMVSLVGSEDRGLAGVISFYGVYDFLPFAENPGPRSLVARLFGITSVDDTATQTMKRYSPLHRAHKDQPPMLLVHGTGERLWDQGRAYADRLAQLGAPHEMYAVQGAPHGIENWEGHADWERYKAKIVDWIRSVAK